MLSGSPVWMRYSIVPLGRIPESPELLRSPEPVANGSACHADAVKSARKQEAFITKRGLIRFIKETVS